MSVLINLVKHSDLLVVAENLSSSIANQQVTFHQPQWLSSYISGPSSHGVYYLEKHHDNPLYKYFIESITEVLRNRQQRIASYGFPPITTKMQ